MAAYSAVLRTVPERFVGAVVIRGRHHPLATGSIAASTPGASVFPAADKTTIYPERP